MSAVKMGFFNVNFISLVETARTGNWDAARLAQCFNDMPMDVAKALLERRAEINTEGRVTQVAPFCIVAGKHDSTRYGLEANYKVIDQANDLLTAIEIADKLSDYPWCFIEFNDRYLQVFHKGFKP